MDSIAYIQRRGVGLYVNGDHLRAYPAARLDPNLRSFIREHKHEIVATIHVALEEPEIELTVGNLLALSPEEREQYRRELETAPDDQPHIDHDREAFRQAVDILNQRQNGAAA